MAIVTRIEEMKQQQAQIWDQYQALTCQAERLTNEVGYGTAKEAKEIAKEYGVAYKNKQQAASAIYDAYLEKHNAADLFAQYEELGIAIMEMEEQTIQEETQVEAQPSTSAQDEPIIQYCMDCGHEIGHDDLHPMSDECAWYCTQCGDKRQEEARPELSHSLAHHCDGPIQKKENPVTQFLTPTDPRLGHHPATCLYNGLQRRQFVNPRYIGYHPFIGDQHQPMGRRHHRDYGPAMRAVLAKSLLIWFVLIQALGLVGVLLAVLVSTIH